MSAQIRTIEPHRFRHLSQRRKSCILLVCKTNGVITADMYGIMPAKTWHLWDYQVRFYEHGQVVETRVFDDATEADAAIEEFAGTH